MPPEDSSYKVQVTLRDFELFLEILPKDENSPLTQTSFDILVNNPIIGIKDGDLHLLKQETKVLIVKDAQFGASAIQNAKMLGNIFGTFSKYSGAIVEVASLLTGALAFDSSGIFISFSQTLKMIAKFRFIKVNFGVLLGAFLEKTGESLEPEAKMSKNSILENQSGTRGKLSAYNKGITTFDLFHYKIIAYMISFIVRIVNKFLVRKMKSKGKINKKLFYFVFYHNRIHFVLFNLYLSGCIFLNARSILHLKYFPNSVLLIFEKNLNIICFFFYWWDIMELLHTSLITDQTAVTVAKETKEKKGDKRI